MTIETTQIPAVLLSAGASLAGLDEPTLADIQHTANRRIYQKGEIICLEGEPCPGLLLVESGWIRGSRTSPQGREQTIRQAGPGEMLNDISLMSGGANLVMLLALEESVLWVVERTALMDLIDRHPVLSSKLIQNLAKESAALIDLVEDLALRPVHARLAHLILEHSRGDTLLRRNWFTEAEIATRIGTTSEIISRVLNVMKEQGTIRLERRKLIILNREQLERMAFQNYKS